MPETTPGAAVPDPTRDAAAVAAAAAARPLVEVAPGVLVATSSVYATTSTVVVGDDGTCLLVDPAVTTDDLEGLSRAVGRAGLRVAAGIATHPHWDHLLWPAGLPPVPRYASVRAGAAVGRHLDELWSQATEGGGRPDRELFGAVTVLGGAHEDVVPVPWAGGRVELLVHDAHAPGHVAVHLLDRGVLLAGDMLSDVEIPLLDRSAADPLGDYERGLARLAAVARACDVVVPGHGAVAHGAEVAARLDADRAYLAALRAGEDPGDARLAEPWLAAEHDAHVALLAGPGGAAP